jgi:peptidoglycan/LPS O-acetylase OafA/YrhL
VGTFRLGQRPALDGLRALAIILVLVYHAGISESIVRGGFLGVEIFFVLSGFLITTLLLEERRSAGTVSLSAFYARRALRLFPALFVMLAIVVAYTEVFGPASRLASVRQEALAAAFYYDDWYRAFALGPSTLLGHTWSLSVEEQFYVVWPLAMLLVLRFGRGLRGALALALAGTLASAVYRAAAWDGEPTLIRVFTGADTRADALLIGCALAILVHSGRLHPDRVAPTVRLLLLPTLLVLALVTARVSWSSGLLYEGGLTVYSLLCAVLLLALLGPASPALRRAFEWRPAVAIGRISYGLYLWHYPLFQIVDDHFAGVDPNVLAPLKLLLTFAFAGASWVIVERPALSLKRHFGRANRAPVAAPAPVT